MRGASIYTGQQRLGKYQDHELTTTSLLMLGIYFARYPTSNFSKMFPAYVSAHCKSCLHTAIKKERVTWLRKKIWCIIKTTAKTKIWVKSSVWWSESFYGSWKVYRDETRINASLVFIDWMKGNMSPGLWIDCMLRS